mmetsp:Transcript_8804/g.14459  ORF Transcript_8804/g.14459 Transcript_8804/m.14459 type:complete len:289 (-) Transcript_8804:153-1019(-)
MDTTVHEDGATANKVKRRRHRKRKNSEVATEKKSVAAPEESSVVGTVAIDTGELTVSIPNNSAVKNSSSDPPLSTSTEPVTPGTGRRRKRRRKRVKGNEGAKPQLATGEEKHDKEEEEERKPKDKDVRPSGRGQKRKAPRVQDRPHAPRNTTQFLIDEKDLPAPESLSDSIEETFTMLNNSSFGSMEGIVKKNKVVKLAVNGAENDDFELSKTESSEEGETMHQSQKVAQLTDKLKEQNAYIQLLESEVQDLKSQLEEVKSIRRSRRSSASPHPSSSPPPSSANHNTS